MTTTQVLWSALPNGFTGEGKARVSIVVSPRLEPDTGHTEQPLMQFAPFVDWPRTLAQNVLPQLQLEFDLGVGKAPIHTTVTATSIADSTLWTKLFLATTRVRSRTTPEQMLTRATPRTLRSFPASLVHEHVQALFHNTSALLARQRLAANSGKSGNGDSGPTLPHFPSLRWLNDQLGPKVVNITKYPDWTHTVLDTIRDTGTIPLEGSEPGQPPSPPHLHAATEGTPTAGQAPSTKIKFIDRVKSAAYQNPNNHQRLAFAETFRFYDRQRGIEMKPPPQLNPPTLDFHDACSLLGDYPELLRKFGLVIDVVVSDLPHNLPPTSRVRVAFADSPSGDARSVKPGLRPWTQVNYAKGQRFEAAPNPGGELSGRMLNLGKPDTWLITELDVDGAAQKYLTFAHSVAQLAPENPKNSDAPDSASLPAQRCAGVTVLHKNRDAAVAARVDHQAEHGTTVQANPALNPDITLFAEDLVRGYRVDVGLVNPATGNVRAWMSLCQRTGTYHVRRDGQPPYQITGIAPDEGYVKSSVASSVPNSDDLYLHEAVFGWDGWSAVAPRPGKTINHNDQPEAVDPPLSPDFPLDAKFQPQPGTLPPLRYGRRYRLRARVVDLAGNSLGPAEAIDNTTASEEITYRRWEPVPPPVVVPTKPFNEGESVLRLVIRSTVEDPASVYGALRGDSEHGPFSATDNLDRSYRGYDERYIAPPKTSQQMAEQHGEFDAFFGAGKPQDTATMFFAAASREAATFLDTQITEPHPPYIEHDLLAEGSIHVAKHSVRDTDPPTKLPVPRGSGLKPGEYVIHDGIQLLVPYLPDPLARGASLRGLPGAEPNHLVEFPGQWPESWPFQLRIEEGDQAPLWNAAARVLTVYLPKAEVAHVLLSSVLEPSDTEVFRVYSLLRGETLRAEPTDHDYARLAVATTAGEDWMVTPFVELVLVHAVERPLQPPQLTELTFDRRAAETFAALTGTVSAHAQSTGRLDIDAAWTEWLDDVTEPKPRLVTLHAHVEDFRLQPGETNAPIGRDDLIKENPVQYDRHRVRHEFGDTRHRNVTYTPTATTRFREYLSDKVTSKPELITQVGSPNLATHPAPLPVPSSRRPDPPEVLYLVPTFRWKRVQDQQQQIHQRRRAGLRVYLKRPWFSSGDDELLAVVLDNQARPTLGGPLRPDVRGELAAAGLDDDLLDEAGLQAGATQLTPGALLGAVAQVVAKRANKGGNPLTMRRASGAADPGPPGSDHYVSRWGVDPVWADATTLAGPTLHSFPNLGAYDVDLSLAENANLKVAVAAFAPQFDDQRGLWYCDIDVDLGVAETSAYFPFLRLALARYQPYSIPGLNLSKVVLADFAQLIPNRTTTAQSTDSHALRVTLAGAATFNDLGRQWGSGQTAVAASHQVIVSVQTRPQDDDLAWQPTGSSGELTYQLVNGQSIWTGDLVPPIADLLADYRLMVEEYELYRSDAETKQLERTPPGAQQPIPIGRRLIHLDTFDLEIGLGGILTIKVNL
jgi:hypothetical protein